VIADAAASGLMVSASLLWTRTLWACTDDEHAQIDCAGACLLANAAAVMLWLAGRSPETAMQSWGLFAAGGSLAHFGLTACARRTARHTQTTQSWGAARWSSMAYLAIGVVSALLTPATP